jgi:predicted metalloprotease with PDZ domain
MSTKSDIENNVKIVYTVSFPEAQAHYMDVEMDISGITQPSINLKMPVWTPGSYLVREFAKNVELLTAKTGHQVLSAKKINKNTWHVVLDGASTLKVMYRIYCFEISVRTNFVNTTHAFISSAATFLYPDGLLDNASTIHIKPYQNWDKVSTGLDMVDDDPLVLHAPDYDTLYDSPIEVGTHDVFGFEACGVKYEVAMCLGGNYDKARLVNDLRKMAEVETDIFGENPNKRYVYIVHNYAKGGGGLEHLNSTVLGAKREGYTDEKTYQAFLSLAAHEHFHLWNVKRLRPIALGPFNYEAENYTTDLWIAEGFTNYYDNLVVHRMGLYPPENYLEALCVDINLVENSYGNKVQPVADASFDAWIKFYRPNEISPNSTISYYSKGSIAAMMLDLMIIHNSNGVYSLDNVMKYTYHQYYKAGSRGYTSSEFKMALEKFAGQSLDTFYADYINGVADIPYQQYLGYAGMELLDELAGNTEPSLGVTVKVTNGKKIIATVARHSAAWVDGLNVNDELVMIDGQPFTDISAALTAKNIGDTVTITIIRDEQTLLLRVTLLKSQQVKYRIAYLPHTTELQLLIREKWLK